MNKTQNFWASLATAVAIVLLIFGGCSTTAGERGGGVKVKLTGDEEVPPVKTTASGSGSFNISSDKSVSGSITTTGVDGTAAHIHEGPAGKNGPIIVPLTKGANNTWSVAPGAKLTDAQYESYKSGNLYVNVHSAANKGGEIRAQLKP